MGKVNVEISIIVPIYNIEKYIEKCIKSILDQTFKNFELLLINDGSPDKSLERCRRFLNDKRVRIISQKNRGLSAARNTGIRNAKGRYLYFIDGDDYVLPDLLETLYNEMILYNADIVQCGFTWIYENQDAKDEVYMDVPMKRIVYGDDWFSYYERYSLLFTVPWNKLYRKELFDTLKYPVGKQFEDEYIVFPLFIRTKKVVLINKAMYYYVQRKDSICGGSGIDERIDAFLEYAVSRLKILYKYDKTKFYCYLYSYFMQLISFDDIVKKEGISREYIVKMKKQAIRLMGYFLVHSNVAWKEKVRILKWNLCIEGVRKWRKK